MKKIFILLVLPCLLYAGEVLSVEGDVKAFVNREWRAVQRGDKIASGTRIMTGVRSTVQIKSPSGTVSVRPMTLMTYTETRNGKDSSTDVRLQTGSVRVRHVRPLEGRAEFRVQTPKGTASVRGTEDEVSYSAVKGMRVVVLAGHVESAGRQLFQGQELGVGTQGKVWENSERLLEVVRVLDEVGEDTTADIQGLLEQLLDEGVSLDDLAEMLGEPQRL